MSNVGGTKILVSFFFMFYQEEIALGLENRMVNWKSENE